MNIGFLDDDYQKDIIHKKDFIDDLIQYTDIDLILVRRAIYHITSPPREHYLLDFETPKIEELKQTDPTEYKRVVSAEKALSTLLNSTVINQTEKDNLKSIKDRIVRDYGIDMLDRKALLNQCRSESEVTRIQDYEHYDDALPVEIVDKSLRTDQQCEGKLINMLTEYLEPFVTEINGKNPYGHQKDYTQKDIFELIAEILNLHWHRKYSYGKIRTIHRNFQTVKS